MTDEMTAEGSEQPLYDLMTEMIVASLERSTLDPTAQIQVRMAALVAIGAPPLSYLLNLGFASDIGLTSEQVQGILTTIAPIVGTARIVAAAGAIAEGLGIAIMVGKEEPEAQAHQTAEPAA